MTQVPVVTEARTSGGWIIWMSTNRIPPAIANKPAQRMRFEVVIFISFSMI